MKRPPPGAYDGYTFRLLAEPWTASTFSFALGADEWDVQCIFGLTERMEGAADPRSDPTARVDRPGMPRMHVGVMMPGGLGDDLWMGAVCAAAKRKHPGCHVTAFSRGDGDTPILGRHPAIDRLVRMGRWRRWNDLAAEMAPRFDLLLDVRYVTKTTYRQGLEPEEQAACDAAWQGWAQEWWDFPARNDKTARRWGQHLLGLIAQTGRLDARPDDMRLHLDPRDTYKAGLLQRPYAVVHCADALARGTKRWPTRHWLRLVEWLRGRINVVQIGMPYEEDAGAGVDLRGRTNPFEMCSVIEGARVLIDSEGGPAHISRAFGTPAVVLFGPTTKESFGYPENVNITSPFRCTGCAWSHEFWYSDCALGEAEPPCMAAIEPEAVMAAAEPLLEGG
jgi:ADP-heptose:LPS heptosyltransferase